MKRLRNEEGYSLDQIGARFDISYERVRQIIGPGNCFEARRRKIAPILVSLYQNSNLPVSRIASEMRMSIPTVARILRDEGIQVEPRPVPQTWTRERIIQAIQLWHERYGEVPGALGWLKKRGLDPRFTEEFPYTSIIQRRFGSFNNAIAAAGFEPLAIGKRRNYQQETNNGSHR